MSQPTAKETVLMRIEIGMDSRTKKAFEEFKAKCSQSLDALSVIAAKTKQADGGLLRAMEAEAANDATKPDTAKLQEITALEKMIKNGKANLKKRLSNNGACRVTENTQKEIDRWEVELSTLKLANNAPSQADVRLGYEFDLATAEDADTEIPAAIAKSSIPELQQLGQWVFEGCDDRWQSAAVDKNGDGYLYDCDKSILTLCPLGLSHKSDFDTSLMAIGRNFDATNWRNSAIDRETVNDVDYLTEVASDDYPDALEQSNWLSESVAPITKTDLQSIFIKNLATTLIQRMHSMDRFSEDDYHVGGDKLLPWDILFYESLGCYAVLIDSRKKPETSDLLFFWDTGAATDINWDAASAAFKELRTITQDELNGFRAALEACYVQPK